jgi:hypothetical protein
MVNRWRTGDATVNKRGPRQGRPGRGKVATVTASLNLTIYALADSDAPATGAAGANTVNEDGSPTHTGGTATPEDQPAADRP